MEPCESEHFSERDRKRCMRQRRELSKQLGVDLPEWEDESTAPPVDEGAIRRVLERTAEDAERHRVWLFILRFRSWAECYCRLGQARRGGS